MILAAREPIPFMSKSNYRHEFQHLLLWGFAVALIEGNFAAIVMETIFHGGDVLVWLASCTQLVMFLTSLFWGALCTGRRKVRLMTLAISGASLILLTVGLTPKSQLGAYLFVLQMASAQFFLTGVITIRTALWKANYPTSDRGKVTARFQMIRAVLGIVALVSISNLFDFHPEAIRWVYPLIAVIGALSLIPLSRIRVRGEEQQIAENQKASAADKNDLMVVHPLDALSIPLMIRRAIHIFSHDKHFLHYCTSLMCTGIGNLIVRTVTVIVIARILSEHFGRGEGVYISAVLIDVMPKVLMIGLLRKMGNLFDKAGLLRFRVMNGVFWLLGTLFGTIGTFFVVHFESLGYSLLPFAVGAFGLRAVMLGLAFASGSLAWNLGHLHFAEPEKAEIYMGIHVSLTGLRGILMPGIGLLLWLWIGWYVWIIALLFSTTGLIGYISLAKRENAQNA